MNDVASSKIEETIAIEVLKTIPNLIKFNKTYVETTKTILTFQKIQVKIFKRAFKIYYGIIA